MREDRDVERCQVVIDAVSAYRETMFIEWTQELLGSQFALLDGTYVTWGDATVGQHTERREMFKKNVAANLEGASRHDIAISQLRQAGAACLNDLVKEAA
jgi:hypothetical protein